MNSLHAHQQLQLPSPPRKRITISLQTFIAHDNSKTQIGHYYEFQSIPLN